MATPTLAEIWQLAVRVPGGIAEEEEPRALAALEDASAWIRTEARRTWLDATGELEDVPGVIVSICCAVARRILDNPDGLLQETVAQYTYSRTNATTDVYLTKQEKAMIRRCVGLTGFEIITLTNPYPPSLMGDEGGYDAYPDWYVNQ